MSQGHKDREDIASDDDTANVDVHEDAKVVFADVTLEVQDRISSHGKRTHCGTVTSPGIHCRSQ